MGGNIVVAGSFDCAFQRHANSALDRMQEDVRAAARAGQVRFFYSPSFFLSHGMDLYTKHHRSSGAEYSLTWSLQALLVRHEAYVADAERERSSLSFNVANLEDSNRSLEAKNGALLEENKLLGVQIHDLNNAVTDADSKVQMLSVRLHDTQQETQRLATLASRAEQLEQQLCQLEIDQARLQATLTRTVADEREVRQRWLACQRKALDLQEQMDSIEKASQEERRLHAQTIARIEQTKTSEVEARVTAVQNELTARVISAQDHGSSTVVSSFVKNILRDHASMQLNMVEMQDMLAQAEDEVEILRHQLPTTGSQWAQNAENQRSLGDEMDARIENRESRELHVHHHYHAPGKQRGVVRNKPQVIQPRRKRSDFPLGSGLSTPRSASSISSSPLTTRLSKLSLPGTEIAPYSKRWSAISTHTKSSATSYATSPPSTIFEMVDNGNRSDFSRPTSPESIDGMSLISPPQRSLSEALMQKTPQHVQAVQAAEPGDKETNERRTCSPRRRSPQKTNKLQRTASHASLLSISGMDIHTSLPEPKHRVASHLLRNQPSLATVALSYAASKFDRTVTPTTVSAVRDASTQGKSSTSWAMLRGNLASETLPTEERYNPLRDTLGTRFVGWVPKRWARDNSQLSISTQTHTSKDSGDQQKKLDQSDRLSGPKEPLPSAAVARLEANVAVEPPVQHVPALPRPIPTSSQTGPLLSMSASPSKLPNSYYRPPGINQMGGLPLPPPPKRMRKVLVTSLDQDALEECLNED